MTEDSEVNVTLVASSVTCSASPVLDVIVLAASPCSVHTVFCHNLIMSLLKFLSVSFFVSRAVLICVDTITFCVQYRPGSLLAGLFCRRNTCLVRGSQVSCRVRPYTHVIDLWGFAVTLISSVYVRSWKTMVGGGCGGSGIGPSGPAPLFAALNRWAPGAVTNPGHMNKIFMLAEISSSRASVQWPRSVLYLYLVRVGVVVVVQSPALAGNDLRSVAGSVGGVVGIFLLALECHRCLCSTVRWQILPYMCWPRVLLPAVLVVVASFSIRLGWSSRRCFQSLWSGMMFYAPAALGVCLGGNADNDFWSQGTSFSSGGPRHLPLGVRHLGIF